MIFTLKERCISAFVSGCLLFKPLHIFRRIPTSSVLVATLHKKNYFCSLSFGPTTHFQEKKHQLFKMLSAPKHPPPPSTHTYTHSGHIKKKELEENHKNYLATWNTQLWMHILNMTVQAAFCSSFYW